MNFLNIKKKKNLNLEFNRIILEIDSKNNLLNKSEVDIERVFQILKKRKLQELENIQYLIKNKEMSLIMLDKSEQKKKQDALECSICLENKKNTALIPCGHVFCENCLRNTTICYNCRLPIEKTHKIYL